MNSAFGFIHVRLSAAMRLRLEIIQSAHLPILVHEKIDNVRADQTRCASDECAFHLIPFCPFGACRGQRRYNNFFRFTNPARNSQSVRCDI